MKCSRRETFRSTRPGPCFNFVIPFWKHPLAWPRDTYLNKACVRQASSDILDPREWGGQKGGKPAVGAQGEMPFLRPPEPRLSLPPSNLYLSAFFSFLPPLHFTCWSKSEVTLKRFLTRWIFKRLLKQQQPKLLLVNEIL